jgi:DNA-binding MarR family transcriptional regulator
MSFSAKENIGYWLFYTQRCIAYAFGEVLAHYCEEHGKPYVVTPAQWGVLSLLFEQDGITISAISHNRGVDAPTVTGIVKRLEQSKLVERLHDEQDRRVVKVYLTEEGRALMQGLFVEVERLYERMLEGFSAEDRRDLLCKLQTIVANISKIGEGIGDRFGLLPKEVVLPKE